MKTSLGILLLLFSFTVFAAESAKPLDRVSVDVFDSKSVRRGAALYADYCLGCHSLRQMRYSRIAKDLNLSEEAMRGEFMLGDAKLQDNIETAFGKKEAEASFGVVPPDISLVIRAKGANWVYSYLKGFYVDPHTPWGVNNLVVMNVAMPNVLWELQGTQKPVFKKVNGVDEVVDVRLAVPGKLSPKEFNGALTDLVNFLAYVAEPSQLQRLPLGKYVILFLVVLTWILYKLKKEYWKNIG